jgi:hypothetical protein
MQTAQVEILINGEVLNTVVKPVTVAEAVILKSLHGSDCLLNPVSDKDESDRLRSVYTDKVVRKVFPGSIPSLPKTFSEVGIDVGEPARSRKQTKAEASQD